MSGCPVPLPSVDTAGLALLEATAALDRHLAVVVTTNLAGTPQVAVVNIGVVPDPLSAAPVVAFVARRGAKLHNLRHVPQATFVVRAGWDWIAVSGSVTLAGPDDPYPGMTSEGLRTLLRRIFQAAGGHHPDPLRYDAVMADERRCAVLLTPERFVTNPPGSEHHEPAR